MTSIGGVRTRGDNADSDDNDADDDDDEGELFLTISIAAEIDDWPGYHGWQYQIVVWSSDLRQAQLSAVAVVLDAGVVSASQRRSRGIAIGHGAKVADAAVGAA